MKQEEGDVAVVVEEDDEEEAENGTHEGEIPNWNFTNISAAVCWHKRLLSSDPGPYLNQFSQGYTAEFDHHIVSFDIVLDSAAPWKVGVNRG